MNKDSLWIVWETDYYEVNIASPKGAQFKGSAYYYKNEDEALSFLLALIEAGYKATIKRHGHGDVTRLED